LLRHASRELPSVFILLNAVAKLGGDRASGDLMRNQHAVSSSTGVGNKPPSGPEIDYSPKNYTRGEILLYGGKVLVVVGIISVLFWLVEKYFF
jgi:hypothetical protein